MKWRFYEDIHRALARFVVDLFMKVFTVISRGSAAVMGDCEMRILGSEGKCEFSAGGWHLERSSLTRHVCAVVTCQEPLSSYSMAEVFRLTLSKLRVLGRELFRS